jgi:hypothetical protein
VTGRAVLQCRRAKARGLRLTSIESDLLGERCYSPGGLICRESLCHNLLPLNWPLLRSYRSISILNMSQFDGFSLGALKGFVPAELCDLAHESDEIQGLNSADKAARVVLHL